MYLIFVFFAAHNRAKSNKIKYFSKSFNAFLCSNLEICNELTVIQKTFFTTNTLQLIFLFYINSLY